MTIKSLLILLFAIQFFAVGSSSAQIPVSLRLDPSTPTGPGHGIFCDPAYNCGLFPQDNSKESTFGVNSMLMSVVRNGRDFLITVDTNGRRRLSDEKQLRLANSGSSVAKIEKRVTSHQRIYLPYEFSHQYENEKGKSYDRLSMRAHYVLRGTFRYRGCVMDLALNDIGAEGKFELSNGDRGTNLQLDRNKDGKFWGKGEFVTTNEIVELCGRNYTVSALSYSRIAFKPTSLKLARVGEKTVDFSINILDGTQLSPASLLGRAFILDFWASWCTPCIGNLPHIKKFRDQLKGSTDVFSINVDKSVRRSLVEDIIEDYDLRSFSSIRGRGEDDPLWKSFGGANQNHLNIPLYVLIDKDSIVRYSGNGGTDLADLKAAVDRVIRP